MGSFLRVDLVADNYQDSHPLKAQTRSNRGSGTTVVLRTEGRLPKNFTSDFMSNSENKNMLYEMMTVFYRH